MPTITLKIDVDTYRGSREGTPNLVRLLTQHKANATFLFSLGPDHTGWALRRAFKPGFFQKVSRTSVVEHYGLKTLMYGVLLASGCSASLQFLAYNTVAYADMPKPRMGEATSLYATCQQLCLSLGVIVAASSLAISRRAGGQDALTLGDFTTAFLAVAVMTVFASLISLRFAPDAGDALRSR